MKFPSHILILALCTCCSHVLAKECQNPNLIDAAKAVYVPLFQDPPDFTGNSATVFRGRVTGFVCEKSQSSCRITFDVVDNYFDDTELSNIVLKVKQPPVTKIEMEALDIGDIQLRKDTEWLVITGHYLSRNGVGSGFNLLCGEWIGEIVNDEVVYDARKLRIPYSQARSIIRKPIDDAGPAGMVRLKNAVREMAKSTNASSK